MVKTTDCILGLKNLSEEISLTVTSPPYGELRDYNGFSFNFTEVAQLLLKHTKEGGCVCWVVGDSVKNGSETLEPFKQALYFKQTGWNVHDTMIYKKRNFSNPEKIRYHQIFEFVFIFSKGKLKTFNPIKDRKNLCAGKDGCVGINTATQQDGSKIIRKKKINTEYGMRYNIWEGLTRGQEEMGKPLPHPAMMPKWLARDLILSFSNFGDLVVDPFAGSGTTLCEAKKLGRRCLGFDISEEYAKIANDELLKSGNC